MPKRVDHQERREHIAAALMRVAATQGLESVSLRHVASEAGVTTGMVQHYFPSKDAMMQFAMDTASVGFEQRITAAVDALGERPSARDLVSAVLTTLMPTSDPGAADDGRVALAFMAYAATRPTVAAGLERSNAGLRDFIASQVRIAISEGLAPASLDPESAAATLMALTDGLAVQMLSSNLSLETATAVLEAQLDRTFTAEHPRQERP
jgi:AcrR family transcriptional regulator